MDRSFSWTSGLQCSGLRRELQVTAGPRSLSSEISHLSRRDALELREVFPSYTPAAAHALIHPRARRTHATGHRQPRRHRAASDDVREGLAQRARLPAASSVFLPPQPSSWSRLPLSEGTARGRWPFASSAIVPYQSGRRGGSRRGRSRGPRPARSGTGTTTITTARPATATRAEVHGGADEHERRAQRRRLGGGRHAQVDVGQADEADRRRAA